MNEVQESYASKVQKILAKAERASTPEEADAFFSAAARLMSKHSITEAMLAKASGVHRSEPVSDSMVMGRNGAGIKARRGLLAIVAKFFDCRAVMSGDRATIFIFGYPEDVEATFKLFNSLDLQMIRAQRMGGITNSSAKTNFAYAYAARISQRLDEIKIETTMESEKETPGTAIALRDKSVAVTAAMNTRFNKLRKGPPTKHRYDPDASAAGRSAANTAVLKDDLGTGVRGELG